MPSATFYNLPEEKRQRLIDAAWAEMTAVSFEKVSINSIIQNANISRGSFYQYFDGKSDLLQFLLDQVWRALEDAMEQRGIPDGDLFELALQGYDWVMAQWNNETLRLPQLICLAQLNPEIDLSSGMELMRRCRKIMRGHVATACLWETDEIGVQDHLELLYHTVGGALLRSIRAPEEAEQIRAQLHKWLTILKYGMTNQAAKGETKA